MMNSKLVLLSLVICLFILIIPSISAQTFTQCTDTDFGDNPYRFGTLTYTNTSGQTSTFTDTCIPNSQSLKEYFCLNGKQASKNIICPGGCNPQTNTCDQVCYNVGDDGYDPYNFGLTILDINQFGINYKNFPQKNYTYASGVVETYDDGSVVVITSNLEQFSSNDRRMILSNFFLRSILNKQIYYAPDPLVRNQIAFESFFLSPLNGISMSEHASQGVGFANFKYDLNFSSKLREFYCDSNGGVGYKDVSCQLKNSAQGIIGECISGTPDFAEKQCQIDISSSGWGNFDNDNSTILDNCCGSLKQDNGLIIENSNEQYLCTLDNGGNWSSLSKNPFGLPGKIFNIDQSETTPKNLFNYSLNKDNYDVLANNNGEFITCDIDNSLDQFYSKKDFSNFGYCVGNSGPKCLQISSSNQGNTFTNEFACYQDGDKEAIAECAVSSSKTQRFNNDAYSPGDYLKSPFSKTFQEFGTQNKCQNYDKLCLVFDNPKDSVEADIKKEFLWGDYDYLEFDINSTIGDVGNLTYEFYAVGVGQSYGLIENSILTKKNGWYKVRIDLSGTIIPPYIQNSLSGPLTATSFKLIAGESLGQVQIENMHFVSSDQLICAREGSTLQAKWVQELDNPQYQSACDSRFAGWTGTRCCGDDYSSSVPLGSHQGKTEYFTDSNGICFDSVLYDQTQFSPIIVKNSLNQSLSSPRLLTNGTDILGCNLDVSYNWTKNIQQTDNNGKVILNSKLNIKEYSSCNVVEFKGKSYFCSPEGWSDESYSTNIGTKTAKDRTILSINLTGTSAQCCSPDTCWNGNGCEYVPPPPQQSQSSATLCVNGQWRTNAGKQTDWLNLESDFCPNNGDCLLDSSFSGTGSIVICESNNWFSKSSKNNNVTKSFGGAPINDKYTKVGGLYCNSGNWTSRTSFIAERLLTLQNDDYTLVCGPQEEVLVNNDIGRAYNSVISNSKEFINSLDDSYFNNLCILSYKKKITGEDIIVIGSSFNELADGGNPPYISLQNKLHQSFDIDKFEISNCEGSQDLYDYQSCPGTFSSRSSNSYFYWNNLTQSFIYTPNGGDVMNYNVPTKLYNLLISPILNILNIANRPSQISSPKPLVSSNLYDFIYLSKHNGKEINMLIEPKQDKGSIKEFVNIRYEGFNEDICSSTSVLDPTGQKIICEKNGTTTNIFAFTGPDTPLSIRSPLDLIKSASTSTRVK